MKNFYQILSKAKIVLLLMVVPMIPFAQTKTQEPAKKDDAKATTETTKKACEKAPTHSYWAITGYGAFDQFNGDLSKNIFFSQRQHPIFELVVRIS